MLIDYEVATCSDERVCNECAKFEGLKFDVLEAKVGVNHPPFHDECRCFAMYSVKGIVKR